MRLVGTGCEWVTHLSRVVLGVLLSLFLTFCKEHNLHSICTVLLVNIITFILCSIDLVSNKLVSEHLLGCVWYLRG